MCDCARRELATPNEQNQSQAQPANNSHRMYQTLLAVNMLGDGLRDTLDPRFAKRM